MDSRLRGCDLPWSDLRSIRFRLAFGRPAKSGSAGGGSLLLVRGSDSLTFSAPGAGFRVVAFAAGIGVARRRGGHVGDGGGGGRRFGKERGGRIDERANEIDG